MRSPQLYPQHLWIPDRQVRCAARISRQPRRGATPDPQLRSCPPVHREWCPCAALTSAHSVPSIAAKTVSPYLLRHTCAIHTLEATGDVRRVSLWLGHMSVQTAEMYPQADPTDDTLDKWRPPSLRKGMFRRAHDELLAMLAAN